MEASRAYGLQPAGEKHVYAESKKPFAPAGERAGEAGLTAQQTHDDMLDIADLLGKPRPCCRTNTQPSARRPAPHCLK